ncbi:MAG: galactose mutarotase [Paramuribaculum sp.]|nr:galactose mutarotase [Paramuribaculum sp.]
MIEQTSIESPKGVITLYTLTNKSGASVTLSTLGAGIVKVIVPDRNGKLDDVVLGYADPKDYFYDGPCAGKVPGRYANRIARGHFSIEGEEYTLAINNGPNALHGGPEGFQNRIWTGHTDGNSVVMEYRSADGEEGYPGDLLARATYTWSDDNKLTLKLHAEVEGKPTVVNLTNHAYWNLDGEGAGSALDHVLKIKASHYLPTDETLIPTGEIAPVGGTPMDFTEPKPFGKDMGEDFPALRYGKGYDNCWMVDDYEKGKLQEVAVLTSPKSGRVLTVETTQPAAQVYGGNWLAGSPENKSGRSMNDYDGIAIECQHTPDAPNQPQLPSTLLRPGESLDETIVFGFSTIA